jgi:hypothetical protein
MSTKIAPDDESDDPAADLPDEPAPEGKLEEDPPEQQADGLGAKKGSAATIAGRQGGVHN